MARSTSRRAAPEPVLLELELELCATGLTCVILPSTTLPSGICDRHRLSDDGLGLLGRVEVDDDVQLVGGRLEDRLSARPAPTRSRPDPERAAGAATRRCPTHQSSPQRRKPRRSGPSAAAGSAGAEAAGSATASSGPRLASSLLELERLGLQQRQQRGLVGRQCTWSSARACRWSWSSDTWWPATSWGGRRPRVATGSEALALVVVSPTNSGCDERPFQQWWIRVEPVLEPVPLEPEPALAPEPEASPAPEPPVEPSTDSTVVIRWAPGRNTTWPSVIVPVWSRPSDDCQRSIASVVPRLPGVVDRELVARDRSPAP